MARRRRRFCVKCGAPDSPDNPVVGHLCLKCLVEESPLFEVKGSKHIVVCPICSSYMVDNAWVRGTGDVEETIRMLAERTVEANISPIPPAEEVEVEGVRVERRRGGRYVARVTALVKVGGAEARQTLPIELDVEKRPCPKCLMKSGKDYDAVLQIRSERGDVTQEELREAGELFAKVGSGEDIVELVEQRTGLDVLLTSKEVAKRAAQLMRFNMGAKIIESHSVVGMRRDGKVRTRLTISVRLPSIREGEGLIFKGEPAIFTGFSRGKFHVYLLPSDREVKVASDDWWSMRKSGDIAYLGERRLRLGTVESVEPLKVRSEGELVEAEGPHGLEEGDEVYLVEYKGKLYALPRPDEEQSRA
ncbi:MAG: hypothetical protein GXO07_02530 [Crenarchaeota archaeon]|nr:hypothetical protein [Thermoproteota archaeon]